MAEPSWRGDANARRQSFRKSLADAALPQEYLDLLEQKRKQLDDSIHKYIAAKERDYKTYEKDLRVQYKQSGNGGGVNETTAGKTRRTSSESMVRDPSNSPQIRGKQQQQSVVDALLANGLSRQQIGQPLAISAVDDEDGSTVLQAKSAAGLVNRRASNEREKEFLGVFTPTFLPALREKVERKEEKEDDVPLGAGRSESAPPAAEPSREGGGEEDALQRANSDSTVQAKLKRPVHLQLAHRTSSSGSSADGRLASALKSPSGERSKRKRVSLAVGDSIVKPSDNVPLSLLNNNRTPSHSRTRSSSSSRKEKEREKEKEKEKMASIDAQVASGLNGVKVVAAAQSEARPSTDPSPQPSVTRQPAKVDLPPARSPEPTTPVATPTSSTTQTPISTPEPSRTKLDPDGDLFDLEDEDEDSDRPQSPDSTSDPDEPIVTGRVQPSSSLRSSSPDVTSDQDIVTSSPADHIESLSPSSYTSPSSARQPTNPGFRRPSANMDPVYRGQDYERAEERVVAEEIYGSRYERAGASSFTSGSLGESFMARNAELMRARVGGSQSQRREAEGVRS
ncbi:hypothetical protein TI39_contig4130g00012 [Zymoseptoria brevis]|uniref:Uncharacterized protein n=1 Tax=Zymoseptoria brevis TaxID=1047168 RepID=A0A0F4GCP9_9PEZI|nr:hypothetical protein TI39_contig4130g00012 [Zymoseptoria brevis]